MIIRAQSLASIIDVSRETSEKLYRFEDLVRKWNPTINLVSKPSLSELWDRHIVDSAQLFSHIPSDANRYLDIGSGGGFPGIVLAVISAELAPMRRFTLVESDQRKAAFLREAGRLLEIKLDVRPARIESLAKIEADLLSARALSPLARLLEAAEQHLAQNGTCLFPKGETYRQEIDDAKNIFDFDYEAIPSLTDPKGAILKIHGIRNAKS
jgi:16S rRNA (guanine527-N7)-methyltransferase